MEIRKEDTVNDEQALEQMPEGFNEEDVKIREMVRELKEPTIEMLRPVLEQVKNGEYQLIIGDDASGRIPTWIVRKVINAAYHEQGRAEIPTRFVAGTRRYDPRNELHREKKAQLKDYLDELKEEISGLTKVLIVTDSVAKGISLVPLVESLREAAIDCDILSVGGGENDTEQTAEERLQVPIHFGQEATPRVYNKWRLSGIDKLPSALHATSAHEDRRRFDPVNVEQYVIDRKELTEDMRSARDEANKVADEIIALFQDPEIEVR